MLGGGRWLALVLAACGFFWCIDVTAPSVCLIVLMSLLLHDAEREHSQLLTVHSAKLAQIMQTHAARLEQLVVRTPPNARPESERNDTEADLQLKNDRRQLLQQYGIDKDTFERISAEYLNYSTAQEAALDELKGLVAAQLPSAAPDVAEIATLELVCTATHGGADNIELHIVSRD